jgi:hypothetical protein
MRTRFSIAACLLVCVASAGLWGQSLTKTLGSGTGFVVSANGYIVTNEHVVHGATEIAVFLGGREYQASLVEADVKQDLALIRIKSSNLPFIQLGDSDQVAIGDTVYTIGCPQGICGTTTAGTVANVGVNSGSESVGYMLLDLTMTYGNSGGPLLNDRAEAVGVTSAVLTTGEQGAQTGFSFAVPTKAAVLMLGRALRLPAATLFPRVAGEGTPLSMKEIRKRVADCVVYVENRKRIALSSLLPTAVAKCKVEEAFSWAGMADSRVGELKRLLTTGGSSERKELASLLAALLNQMSAETLCSLLGFSTLLAPGLAYLPGALTQQEAADPFQLMDLFGPQSKTLTELLLRLPSHPLDGTGLPVAVERLGRADVPYAQTVISNLGSDSAFKKAVFLTAVLKDGTQATAMADRLRAQEVGKMGSVAAGTFEAGDLAIPYTVGVSLDNSTRKGGALDKGDYCTGARIEAMATFTVDEVLCTIHVYWSATDCSASSPTTLSATSSDPFGLKSGSLLPSFPSSPITVYPTPHPGSYSLSDGCVALSHDDKTSTLVCADAVLEGLRDLLNLQLQAVSAAFGTEE